MNSLVVSGAVIGADKPGIVESLADTITRQQGNWLASSMSELAGQFAGILHVAVPDEHYRSLCGLSCPSAKLTVRPGSITRASHRLR